jgi:hypothetical protein
MRLVQLTKRSVKTVLFVAVLAISPAGCSDGNASGAPAASTEVAGRAVPISAPSTIRGASAELFVAPAGVLAVFDANSPDRASLSSALNARVSGCKVRAGFAGQQVNVAETPGPVGRPFWEANFGLFDIANARVNGYQFVSPSESGPGALGQVSLEYEAALEGVDGEVIELVDPLTRAPLGSMARRGGCAGEAIDAVYGSFDAYLEYLTLELSLQQAGFDLLEREERVRSSAAYLHVVAEWSDCMARLGFTYSNQFEPAQQQWPRPPSQAELDVAIADVQCKFELGMKEAIASLLDIELNSSDDESLRASFDEFNGLTARDLEALEG